MKLHAPYFSSDLARIVREAFSAKAPLSVAGNATRAGLGRPVQTAAWLTTKNMTGVTLHEPAELVVAAQAGTPVSTLVETLAAKGQRLPFEPIDHRRLLGTAGEPTVGGIAATNASGPARITLGAARDSMIGVKFVNGRGEEIVSGGRVMKNVTGLDLVKGLAGSFGTLAVIHEVCFKVLPKPEREATLSLVGLPDGRAIEALSAALTSPFEPTGAAHLPGNPARTLIRIEGPPVSIAYRTGELAKILKTYGTLETLSDAEAETLWADIRDAAFFAGGAEAVWRLSVAPSKGASVGDVLKAIGGRVFYDWGGGLVWAALPEGADAAASQVHATAKAHGGHATLVRASEAVRLSIDVFSPPAGSLMTIQKKIKGALDPACVFNPGRMYAGL